MLSKGRRVIGVDLQAHGRTADIDRPMSFEFMADDIAALTQHLGYDQVDVIGYSLGGGVALQTAIRYPELVNKLVLISTPCKRDGWYPEVLAGMEEMNLQAAEAMEQSPIYQLYASIAPKPEDWSVLVAKLGELPYDWSEDFAGLKAPTMIVVGDADSVRTAHTVEMFELLGGGKTEAGWDGSGMPDSRLAILPATSHYNILSSPLLAPAVTQFLDAAVPKGK
jgi:pimeloyl-ACP methyl ester carboxylesterase